MLTLKIHKPSRVPIKVGLAIQRQQGQWVWKLRWGGVGGEGTGGKEGADTPAGLFGVLHQPFLSLSSRSAPVLAMPLGRWL